MRGKMANTTEENKFEHKGGFSSSVLFNSETIVIQDVIDQVKEDWGIEIEGEANQDKRVIIANIDGRRFVSSLMDAQMPTAIEDAKRNFFWNEAEDIVREHKSHLLVVILPTDELSGDKDDALITSNNIILEVDTETNETAILYAKILYSIAKLDNVCGVAINGCVYEPVDFIEMAESALEENRVPILNLVYFGLHANEDDTFGACTFGLRSFGKEEMEVLNFDGDVNDLYGYLVDITAYLIESGATLNDGETIGFKEDHKLSITLSEGVLVDGNSLKIGF